MNALADPTWGLGVEVAVEVRSRYSELIPCYCFRKLQDFWTPNMPTAIKSTISAVSMFSC